MGKAGWPDWDALIQKAVNAGRIQGTAMAKDTYKLLKDGCMPCQSSMKKLRRTKKGWKRSKPKAHRSTARGSSDTPAPGSGSPRKKSLMG